MASRDYRDLIVWKKSMDLVVAIYQCTKEFPESEKFGLISQMRRSAISIPSNLAEGSKRGSSKDFRQFVLIAYGSGAELETQLEIAKRLKYLQDTPSNIEDRISEVMKMLNVLSHTFKTN